MDSHELQEFQRLDEEVEKCKEKLRSLSEHFSKASLAASCFSLGMQWDVLFSVNKHGTLP